MFISKVEMFSIKNNILNLYQNTFQTLSILICIEIFFEGGPGLDFYYRTLILPYTPTTTILRTTYLKGDASFLPVDE